MNIRPTPALLVANITLAFGLAALWLIPSGQIRGVAWTAPAPVVPEIAPPTGIAAPKTADVSGFLAVLERPLFSPSRRPPPPPAPAKAEASPEPDPFANIQLQGVYTTEDGGGIFARVDGKNRRIPVGGALGAWSLKVVREREVTFARGDDTRVVPLVPAKLAATAPVPLTSASTPVAGAQLAGGGKASPAPSQIEDPVLRQQQEREERERIRLEQRNARRAAAGLPPVTR